MKRYFLLFFFALLLVCSLAILTFNPTPSLLTSFENTKPSPSYGHVIMSHLELGHSSWHLLHTITGRFPLAPTHDEQNALLQFIHLLSRLYPCGECAEHFQQLLMELPPNVKSRNEASKWACEAHNAVNKRLGKEQFDCAKVHERWKCGCDEEAREGKP